MARAIRQRWPITQKLRGTLVKRLEAIIESGNSKPRDRISAGRVLAALDAQNMEQERRDLDAEVLSRLDAMEAALASIDADAACRDGGEDSSAPSGPASPSEPA